MIIDPTCYELLANNFQKQGLLLSAAEIHGMMLGYLSVNPEPCFKTWTLLVDDLLLWDGLDERAQEQLSKLFLAAHMELIQQRLDLTLALPDADQSFLSRLSAFADWCRGYLYGVGLSDPPSCLFDDYELQNLLNDITQFSQVDLEIEPMENTENELNEIIQHLALSVNLIYTKCKKEAMAIYA